MTRDNAMSFRYGELPKKLISKLQSLLELCCQSSRMLHEVLGRSKEAINQMFISCGIDFNCTFKIFCTTIGSRVSIYMARSIYITGSIYA